MEPVLGTPWDLELILYQTTKDLESTKFKAFAKDKLNVALN